MKRLKKLWQTIKREWPLELSATIFLVVAFALLTTKLRTLLGGYSQTEIDAAQITASFPSVIEHTAYWPYYAAVYVARFLVDDAVLAARLVSVALGFIAVVSLFMIIRRWFNTQVAIVGSAVFVSGSWFLQLARTGTPEILGIAVVTLLCASVLWLINRPKKLIPAIAVFLTTLSAWFVPFLPWLLVAGLVLATLRERALLKIVPLWAWILLGVSVLSVITTLVLGFSNDSDQIALIFGIPTDMPSFGDILSSLRGSLAALFWYAPTNPERWLANLPLLDIFGVVMVTLGVYHHERSFGDRRSLVLFGSIGIIALFLALNGGINSPGFSLLLPLTGLLLISGIHEFLGQWSKVFPRNPLARLLAVSAITVLVTMSAFYQLNRYFVAWPGAPETKQIYSANLIEPQTVVN